MKELNKASARAKSTKLFIVARFGNEGKPSVEQAEQTLSCGRYGPFRVSSQSIFFGNRSQLVHEFSIKTRFHKI
jgi:hypothetical protein